MTDVSDTVAVPNTQEVQAPQNVPENESQPPSAKRVASNEPDDVKQAKSRKTCDSGDRRATPDLIQIKFENAEKNGASTQSNNSSNTTPAPATTNTTTSSASPVVTPIAIPTPTSTTTATNGKPNAEVDAAAVAAAAAAAAATTNGMLNMSAAQQSQSQALFITEQHQQFLQSYAQASGQDLANLTASSLAQAMVSPIAVPGLNLLQHLQGGNVITALPGPPQIPQPTAIPQSADTANNNQASESPIDDGDSTKQRNPATRNMSNDERRQRRLLRNRMAAKECRKKKKQYIQDMEDKIKHLEEENARLHKQVDELNAKMALGVMQNSSESYRLMKEVEELNAKLAVAQPQQPEQEGVKQGDKAQLVELETHLIATPSPGHDKP
ncbi:hypothetical protein BJV82DRAFT_577778 [Fennellomyces sp. T-0311]|nr:hypothetical protein BJV82DRAFT_577778 [Fennellomyces sp. T-0311]